MSRKTTNLILVSLNVALAGLLIAAFLSWPVVRYAEEELGARPVAVHYIYVS
jgi:hypothetical protein